MKGGHSHQHFSAKKRSSQRGGEEAEQQKEKREDILLPALMPAACRPAAIDKLSPHIMAVCYHNIFVPLTQLLLQGCNLDGFVSVAVSYNAEIMRGGSGPCHYREQRKFSLARR